MIFCQVKAGMPRNFFSSGAEAKTSLASAEAWTRTEARRGSCGRPDADGTFWTYDRQKEGHCQRNPASVRGLPYTDDQGWARASFKIERVRKDIFAMHLIQKQFIMTRSESLLHHDDERGLGFN